MKPSIATSLSDLTTIHLNALEVCSEELVYAPGHIQPYGVLLVLQPGTLKILQASANVEQVFGIPANELADQPLQRLLSQAQVQYLADAVRDNTLARCNPFELKARRLVKGGRRSFQGTLHQTAEVLLLELEAHSLGHPCLHASQFYHRLQAAISRLRHTTNLAELTQVLAQDVKAITGCDRVMIYRFEADDHGVVIAEEKEDHLDSFLGLHYPAFDIPVPARKLFYGNWVRHIPDVNYTPADLMPASDVSVDLSTCLLRGVAPCHIEYLQNMGVAASLTISLVDDQRLWGLIACHHYSLHWLDYETRKTCEFLGQFASVELVHQQERELNQYRTQVSTIQAQLQREFLQDANFIEQVLTRNGVQLLDLVHAQGVAILLDGRLTLIGATPTVTEVKDLVEWLGQNHLQPSHIGHPAATPASNERVFVTSSLARLYPPAAQFQSHGSGVLAISIWLSQAAQKAYHILWFRPEQIQTVNWAGNPQDAVTVDDYGNLRLCPRTSFALWQETVQGMSTPWQRAEVDTALAMRNTLMLAVLEFSQAALAQAAEQAAIANRAKSQFLAKMSHELRTPLNAILGFTQLMTRNDDTPTEFQNHLGIISRSGEHLLTLINDVLEMSKIEAGQIALSERPFHLQRLLNSIYEMFALKASQKGLRLILEQHPQVPCYVYSDEAKLRQILINLISNAIKFTTWGSVTLRVNAAPVRFATGTDAASSPGSADEAIALYFEVVDTGCGIDIRHWDSIFEAFMQTEQGRRVDGTGLGLAISRQFARLMGGNITVQSTINQGSTFTCKVLLRQPASLALVEPESTVQPVVGLAPNQPTYRILIVEDVPENRQLLLALLRPIGFDVSVVENGAEAIDRWHTWHPHLILMDIHMPTMDGYAATSEIRLQEQRCDGDGDTPLPPTKIIALTAYAFESDRADSLAVGCDDYLAKPFTETALLATIARHLPVCYRYADTDFAVPMSLYQRTLTQQDFKNMSLEWIAQVYEAALDLSDDKIRSLIDQIPASEEFLIQGMTFLVDNFQLEAIATLTQT